jgi:hypothetical protein
MFCHDWLKTPEFGLENNVYTYVWSRHPDAKTCAQENATYIASRSRNGAIPKGPGGYFANFRKCLKIELREKWLK